MDDQIVNLLASQIHYLDAITSKLDNLLASLRGPNFRRAYADFAHFDWTDIGATITAKDRFGPSQVEWANHRWTRRAGDGKFGKAIWFSRATGRNGDTTEYARLITFKDDAAAEPLPEPKAAPPKLAAPAPKPGQAPDATDFWTIATQAIQAGAISQDDAGTIAKDPNEPTWQNKIDRLRRNLAA